jgi:GH24 family phage-related lysozyme (muramidase)
MPANTPEHSPLPAARKPVFDLVRRLLRRGFLRAEVAALDDTLDAAFADAAASRNCGSVDRSSGNPVRSVPRIRRTAPLRIGADGIALIKRFEGCARLRRDGLIEAYPDPGTGGEPWTIGWGATGAGLEPGSRIGPGTVWTQAQCDARLADDLVRYARDVARAIGTAPTTQSEFDALVSFHYNTGAIARATLTRLHVAGDTDGAAAQFKRWNMAGGRVLRGLVRRRAAEEALYRQK